MNALYDRLMTLPIGPPGADLSFVGRLARENGWTEVQARSVVREYRRFLYLAATAEEMVTPSDAVDQAWHLHLVYTRSYWDGLCRDVLGFPLHHEPTAGGPAERARFVAAYEATLARYRAVFGEEPPAAVWPTAAVRFGRDLAWYRVNLELHAIVRRRWWWRFAKLVR